MGTRPGWRRCRSISMWRAWRRKINARRRSSQLVVLLDSTYIDYLTNNPRLTWDDLKVSLEEYYGVVSNPNARLAELAKIRQGGMEGIQEYIQRVVRLAKSAYAGIDRRNKVVSKQVLGFFIEGLREREIKKSVMKDEPQTLEAAYQKALSEWKWKIRLDEVSEYEDKPMEVCHSRRQLETRCGRESHTRPRGHSENPRCRCQQTPRGLETRCGREGHTRPRGPSENPQWSGPQHQENKTQRDGHNSGVKI